MRALNRGYGPVLFATRAHSVPSHSQVSSSVVPSRGLPLNSTVFLRTLSYAICGLPRADGGPAGVSCFQWLTESHVHVVFTLGQQVTSSEPPNVTRLFLFASS